MGAGRVALHAQAKGLALDRIPVVLRIDGLGKDSIQKLNQALTGPHHPLAHQVRKTGSTVAQAFLQHQGLFAQSILQAGRPLLRLIETNAAFGAVSGGGTITMGIGIAETDDMLFPAVPSPFASRIIIY